MTDEQNSAEREAEKIFEEAWPEARAEECPQGEECPVHFRVDEVYFEPKSEYARLITYSGDYAVVTEDNHELENPITLIKLMLGAIEKEDLPPRWETMILRVGSGSIGDLTGKGVGFIRYTVTHDDWDAIQGVHEVTVSGLQAGLIDVDKQPEG